MKRFFISLIACAFVLSGCSFLSSPTTDPIGQKEESITSFEFVTDTQLVEETTSSGKKNYILSMYIGDTYQIKTDVDNKLGTNYHFEYDDYDENNVEVSSTGLVSAKAKSVEAIRLKLMRNKDNKRIDYKYLFVNIREPSNEYANIKINDSSLSYNEATKTYSLSLKGGDDYRINTSITYNVAYNQVFELADNSYSSFMSVSSTGHITTEKVNEDKDGQVVIKTTSIDNSIIYDTVYLNVHIEKDDSVIEEKDLEVINQNDETKLKDNDILSLFVNESMTFTIKYGKENIYEVMTVSDEEVLTLDNELNKITAKKVGSSDVTFIKEDKSLTIHIEVKENALTEIYAKNGGDDFIIINNDLVFLGRIFAKYASLEEVDITKSNDLSYQINELDDTYKAVTLSYNDGVYEVSVTYNVKYYVTNSISESVTSYNFSDYFDNYSRGKSYVLPQEGNIHMLVIPVWFTNSTSFFREDQKIEIVNDLEYVYNTYRNKDDFHCVKQFYEEESNGKLVFDITISDFYSSNTSSKIYGDTVEADIKNTFTLTDNAINWYFENHLDESISDYDSNNDGLVDAVSLVYAANYYGTIGDSNGTTAFQYKNNTGNDHKYNNGSFSPIGGIYGFNKNVDPAKQLGATDLSKYYPDYYFKSGSRTIIHETGHMFGFDDLYEDNHASIKYYPAGRFNMQSHDLGGHDPYQMNLVGWSKPTIYDASEYEVGETIKVNINDFTSSGNNILLTREMNEYNSLFDEYMLLELLAPTGLNYFDAKYSSYTFSDAGIRLWHVNSKLEDLTSSGKETSEISNNNWVNLKYSNNDQSSKFDLAHWIRNNEEETYDTVSSIKDGYGLFKSDDHFDMETYKSQFINEDKLDNKEKLGWEFNVDSIYQSVDNTYGAIITLIRVDNTRTDFDLEARINKDISEQPSVDGNDYALELLGNNDLFSLVYNFNEASIPSYYTQSKPISSKGLCLFASTTSNGGSLVITIKEKEGYQVIINSISITHSMLTKASLTALVNEEVVEGTSFSGPYNDYDGHNEKGLTFEVNSNSITLVNRYTGGTDYWSVLALYGLSINYHMEKL